MAKDDAGAWMSEETFDRWWGRFVRSMAFLIGAGIMVYETVVEHSDRPWLYAAAVGMMGLPIARAAENIVSKFAPGPKGPGSDDPPEDPPPRKRAAPKRKR